MKNIFLVMVLMVLAASCNSNSSNGNSAGEDMKITALKGGCYASFSGKDTILLKIEISSNVVTGILKYQIWEKDKNEGTIEGKLQGDTLFADYTFSAEGQVSVREVAFLLNGNEAIEGYGDMEEKNGEMVFTDKTAIDFSKGTKLSSVNCHEHDDLFQLNSLEKSK